MAVQEKLHIWKDVKYPYRHTMTFYASKSSGEVEEYKIRSYHLARRKNDRDEIVKLERMGLREHRESAASGASSGGRRPSLLKRTFTSSKRGSVSEGEQPV